MKYNTSIIKSGLLGAMWDEQSFYEFVLRGTVNGFWT